MRYIKIILTIIAILLALNLVKPFVVREAIGSGVMDVNITHIAGYKLFSRTIPVDVD